MDSGRQLGVWFLAALAACLSLAAVLIWENRGERSSWTVFLAGNPQVGSQLFRQRGCSTCHTAGEREFRFAPELRLQRPLRSSPIELASAMWNRAPRMHAGMRDSGMTFHELSSGDLEHLFAFLHASRYVGAPGDPDQGRRLFQGKGCLRCHATSRDGARQAGPVLIPPRGDGRPAVQAQAMWNHAGDMEARMMRLGLDWPELAGREMDDLIAYIQQAAGDPRQIPMRADPGTR
jgi:cytochrome c2